MTENTQRIAELQRELAANPASRQFYQLGELLRRDGRFGEATEVLNAGLVHHPRYMAAWVALGRACLENGKARDALHGLEQALVLDAQNPVAWRLLGEARLVLGDRLGALDAMTRCLELVPGDSVLQAAVDSLASETAPPQAPPEYAPMPEAAGAPAEPAPLKAEPVPPPVLETAPPEAVPGAPEVFPEEPLRRFEAPGERGPGATAPAAAASEDRDVFGAAPVSEEPFAGAGAAGTGPFEQAAAATFPDAGGEFQPAPPVVLAPPPPPAAADAPPVPPMSVPEEAAAVEFAAPVEAPPLLPADFEAVRPAEPAAEEVFAAPPVREAGGAPAPAEPAQPPEPPPSIALARLYLQQQAPDEAVHVLERLLEKEPDNVEASDLLALVRDMMMPLPAAPPPLSPRERKIAALQRFLASLTLGWERASR